MVLQFTSQEFIASRAEVQRTAKETGKVELIPKQFLQLLTCKLESNKDLLSIVDEELAAMQRHNSAFLKRARG
jgi:hypothetical protein